MCATDLRVQSQWGVGEVPNLRSCTIFFNASRTGRENLSGVPFSRCFTVDSGEWQHIATANMNKPSRDHPLVIKHGTWWCFNGNHIYIIYNIEGFFSKPCSITRGEFPDTRPLCLCASCVLAAPGALKPPMSGLPDLNAVRSFVDDLLMLDDFGHHCHHSKWSSIEIE